MDDASPGWDAITAACERLYGAVEPLHYGTILKWSLGGQDPLDGISAYPRDTPVPHWHLVSYGMTELYSKDSEDPAESGWGFEFTFRVARAPGEEQPPAWALNVLQNLGRYVFSSGNWFESGHHMNINGPIAADREDCAVRAIAFVTDPELGEIDTPHGRVRFLQIVGLTTDEHEAAQRWRTEGLLELLEPRLPLLVTDITRGSLLDGDTLDAVRAGTERDGSNVGALFVSTAHWERGTDGTTLRLGALQAPSVADALRGRLPFGRDLALQSEETALVFAPAAELAVAQPDPETLRVGIPETLLEPLVATLLPEAGVREVAPGLRVEIVPTAMRDQYGNETGETVG